MDKNRIAYEFLMTGDHDKIIYGALKKLSILKGDDRFDDFVQEAWLIFPELYDRFPGNPEMERKRALAYFHNALYRRFLNILRYQKYRQASPEEVADILEQDFSQSQIEQQRQAEQLYVQDQLDAVYAKVGRCERHYLEDALVHQLTPTEIARKRGVSRQTVYGWRRRAQLAWIRRENS